MKFGVDIQSQSKVNPETKKSNMAARWPFWKWRRWKPIGFYPYIYKTASFQKEAMRTQVALWLFYEVKFI